MRFVFLSVGLLFAAASIPPRACEPSTTAYVISAIPPNGTASTCLRLDPYSFTVTGNLIQVRTHFIEAETPSGFIDGVNATFRLAGAPAPQASLHLYRNGLIQKPGFDYLLSGLTITFFPASKPTAGDSLIAFYRF